MIYFIRNERTGAIKIGCAANPVGRLRTLQTATPDKLLLLGFIDGTRSGEAVYHRRFSSLHISGEWFEGADWLMEVIERELQAKRPPWMYRNLEEATSHGAAV